MIPQQNSRLRRLTPRIYAKPRRYEGWFVSTGLFCLFGRLRCRLLVVAESGDAFLMVWCTLTSPILPAPSGACRGPAMGDGTRLQTT